MSLISDAEDFGLRDGRAPALATTEVQPGVWACVAQFFLGWSVLVVTLALCLIYPFRL